MRTVSHGTDTANQNSTNGHVNEPRVTEWSPAARKRHLDQFSSAAVAQNALSDLEYRAYALKDYTNRTCRTITAIRAAVGQNRKDADGVPIPAHRSRLAIAAHLQINSDDDEFKRRFASKAVAAMVEDFARCGVKAITVIPGKPGTSPAFVLDVDEPLEIADAMRRQHPRWKSDQESRIKATEDAAEWLASQLPAADPLPDKQQGEPLNDREYTERFVANFIRVVDSGLDHLEGITSEPRVRSVEDELRRQLDARIRSRRKTLPARRPTNGTSFRTTGRERECAAEIDPSSLPSPVEEEVSFSNSAATVHSVQNGVGKGSKRGTPPTLKPNDYNNEFLGVSTTPDSKPDTGPEPPDDWEDFDPDYFPDFDPDPELPLAAPLEQRVINGESDDPAPLSSGVNSGVVEPDPVPLADLPRHHQAVQSVHVWTSRGHRRFFYRHEDADRNTAGSHRYDTNRFSANVALDQLAPWLAESDDGQWSFMVRPAFHALWVEMTPEEVAADDAAIYPRPLHVDDLDADGFARIREWLHWGFETSPGRYQGVLFVNSDKPTAAELRRRLVRKVGGDPGANGSFRWPGSKNWKPSRGGCDVRLHIATYGDTWTRGELERSGFLAPPEPPRPPLTPVKRGNYHPVSTHGLPDWGECEAESFASGARGKDGGVDQSDVDWRFVCRSHDLKIDPYDVVEEVTRRRNEITPDKLRKSPDYVRITVGKVYGVLL